MTAHAMTHPGGHAAEHDSHNPVANTVYGFWLYIMTDCILFATLFATYAVMSGNFAGGPTGKDLFELPYVLGETMCLLFSSVTYGFAMLAMHRNRRQQVMAWLLVTFFLGLGFIAMELNEFSHMIMEGHGPDRSGFLSGFFTLVGTHGAHVSVGLLWMGIMMWQVMSKGLSSRVQSRLARLSMFWHFLDVIWIGVFTIVYLTGVL